MRCVLQKVTSGSVTVNGSTISKIGPGLVALIGIGVDDSPAEINSLVTKILNLRIWNDNETAEALKTNASSIPSPKEVGSTSSTTSDATSNDQPQVSEKRDVDTELKVENLELTQKSRSEEVWGGVPWRRNVMTIGGEILCISQFTLYAKTTKGTKPDFHKSMRSESAKILYDAFLKRMGELYSPSKIKDGEFGAMMQVGLTNDGPVTFILDSDEKKEKKEKKEKDTTAQA